MRLSSKAVAACALLSFSPLCLADFYVGGAGTLSSYKYDDVKSGFGGSVFGGYRAESIPLVFEAAYLTTGKNKVDGSVDTSAGTVSDMSISFTGETFSLGYFGRFDRKGSGVFGRVGYYTGKAKLQADVGGSPLTLKETSSGAMFAIGVDWMLTPYFGFRADIGNMFNVKSIPTTDEKSNVTTANLGVVFSFGGPDADASRFGRRTAQKPVYRPAVPAPAPAPAPTPAPAPASELFPPVEPIPAPPPAAEPVAVEPAPAAPVAVAAAPVAAPAPAPSSAPASAVGSAQLVPGAVLRSGPTMKSASIRTLSEGGSVKLFKRETNGEGPWWNVQLEDGTTGWMIEWGLMRIKKN